jgi:hypothetical protein
MDCEKQCLLKPFGDNKQPNMLPVTNPSSGNCCCQQQHAAGRCQYKQLKQRVLVYTGQATLVLLGALLLLACASGAIGMMCGLAPGLAASTCAARNQVSCSGHSLQPAHVQAVVAISSGCA